MLGPKKTDPDGFIYLDKWEPVPDRAWALEYIDADGAERYEPFVNEFRRRHKYIRVNQVDGYLPASVDDYVRHDATGRRLDLDYDLMALPLDPDDQAMMEKATKDRVRERRRAALEARGKLPRQEKSDRPKQTSIAERMSSAN